MYRSIPCKSFGFLDLGLWDEVSFGILIVKAKIIRCRTKEGVGRKKDSPSDAAPQGGNESSLVWIRYWGGESQPDELVKGFGSMPSAIASRKVKLLRISFFFLIKDRGNAVKDDQGLVWVFPPLLDIGNRAFESRTSPCHAQGLESISHEEGVQIPVVK